MNGKVRKEKNILTRLAAGEVILVTGATSHAGEAGYATAGMWTRSQQPSTQTWCTSWDRVRPGPGPMSHRHSHLVYEDKLPKDAILG